MSETELLRRYALALALIPDIDAAGDLFMDARDDDDLHRRAAAWRQRLGFPALTADPPLPFLTPAEVEHARHLAERARRRRRLRWFGMLGATALLAVTVAMGGLWLAGAGPVASLPAWASNPVYANTTAARSTTANGVTLTVYRAEVSPGRVTVWWSAAGPGALSNWKSLQPKLLGRGTEPVVEQNLTARDGRDRTLGQTTYRRLSLRVNEVTIRLDRVGSREVGAEVAIAPWRLAAEPDARTYQVPRPDAAYKAAGPMGLETISYPFAVTVGPGYTAVAYPGNMFGTTTLSAGGQNLARRDADRRGDGTFLEYYDGVPAGATELKLTLAQPIYRSDRVTVDLPGSLPGIPTITQRDRDPVIVASLPVGARVQLSLPGTAYDEQGNGYSLGWANVVVQVIGGSGQGVTEQGYGGPYQTLFAVNRMPKGTRLVRLAATRVEAVAAPPIVIPLKP